MQRLGKNKTGYVGDAIDIAAVLGEIETIACAQRWTCEVFHKRDAFQWLALGRAARVVADRRRRVYLSAGIHGDEPAGPLAALRLIREAPWRDEHEILFCPCLNPAGFSLNRRENADGVDLNRDYRTTTAAEVKAHVQWLERQEPFDLCMCLHEDWEANGFYVYELNPEARPSLAEPVVAAVSKVCPVDQAEIIEGRPARDGVIRPNLDPRLRPDWPEAFWLLQNKTRLSYTLEAPSDFPLKVRVNALVAGVNAALAAF